VLLLVLLSLPWLGLALYLALRVRLPPELPDGLSKGASGPLLTVIVPARNEAHNIRRVLESLAASEYPAFEIIVVDDRSRDGTAELARSVDPGRARRLEVVDGDPLPAGWLGKPWACWQGYLRARGDLLLFTDADTVHGPRLLGRAVAGLLGEEDAPALTLVGRQLAETFWERLVQPQILLTLVARFPDPSRRLPPDRWRSAIANGQYILFRRDAYEALGGHRRVRGAVVEDMRLAQLVVESGSRMLARRAEDGLATRMYRSLDELVAGWSKNLVPGSLLTVPSWLRPVIPAAMLLAPLLLWAGPPAWSLSVCCSGARSRIASELPGRTGSSIPWGRACRPGSC
jgi:chlorobactene glucosyltransferase